MMILRKEVGYRHHITLCERIHFPCGIILCRECGMCGCMNKDRYIPILVHGINWVYRDGALTL